MARIIREFECSIAPNEGEESGTAKHHEDTKSLQVKFRKDVSALATTMEEMGNPFSEGSEDLLVLDTKEIMGADAVERMRKAEKVGEEQYEVFVKYLLVFAWCREVSRCMTL